MALVKGNTYYFVTASELSALGDAVYATGDYTSLGPGYYAVEPNWDSDYWSSNPDGTLPMAVYNWSGQVDLYRWWEQP